MKKSKQKDLAGIVAFMSVCAGGPAVADVEDCSAEVDAGVEQKAQQKVLLLEQLVGDTDPVRRVFASGKSEAVAAIDAAREAARKAKQELDAGCNSAAVDSADKGLNRASEAFRLSRNEPIPGEPAYLALQERTQSFLQALLSQPVDLQGIGADDLNGMRRQLDRAAMLAVDGDYTQASALLRPVADRLERRLIAIFNQRTVFYDRSFAGPKEEFDYLAEQVRGYELLLEQVTTEREFPFSARSGYEQAMSDGLRLAKQAKRHAGSEEWPQALRAMRDALEKYEQALRLTGLSY